MPFSFSHASTTLTDRYGIPLRTLLPGEEVISYPVTLEEVSPWVVLTTLAAEDKRFFTHPGVDFEATARALWQNTSQGHVVSGASTVTQQLVRLMEPHPKTITGKLKEALNALRLERRMSKHDILQAYLNQVSYGNRCQGIEAAARTYFGESSRDLSLAQAALLAGIPKSPTGDEPVRHWKNAVARQQTVFNRMKDWGWLSPEAYMLAASEKIQVAELKTPWTAPHFTEYLWSHSLIPPAPGDAVRTTLDSNLQETVEGLVRTHIERLRSYHVTNGAVIVIDNATGDVLSWVGSVDYSDVGHQGQVDGVVARRQPGSALKPFLYARAFTDGMTPADILMDEPLYVHGYMPRNYDDTFHGPVRAREALACSLNIPAVLVAERVGLQQTLNTFHAFGLASLDRPADYYGPGLVLGNGEVTLLELANAYATLGRGGIWKPLRVVENQSLTGTAHRAMDRESVFLVSDILSDNNARSRSFGLNSPFHMSFPIAAKTGTTKDYHDNWAMGYTPDWTIGVWVGNFDGQPMRGISGITGAGPLMHDVAVVVEQRCGSRPFTPPIGIRDIEICPDSGKLPGASCPSTMLEVFARQHVPTETCDLHDVVTTRLNLSTPQKLAIEFPVPGDIFKVDPRAPRASQTIHLKANQNNMAGTRHWSIDHHDIPIDGSDAWWPLEPGRHVVRLEIETPEHTLNAVPVHFLVVP